MKATINSSGILKIQVETELEGYALDRWCDENINVAEITTEHMLFCCRVAESDSA